MRFVLLSIALGIAGRIGLILLAPAHGYAPDHDDFVRWGNLSTNAGILALYVEPAPRNPQEVHRADGTTYLTERAFDRVLNYGPGAAYLIRAEAQIHRWISPSSSIGNTLASRAAYSALSIPIDLLMAIGVACIAATILNDHRPRAVAQWWRHRWPATAFCLAFLAPPTAVVGAFWGQIDGHLLAAAVWMLFAMIRSRWLLAGLLWGVALSLKPQGLVFLPIWGYAIVVYRGHRTHIALGPLVAAATLNALAIPFWIHSGSLWFHQSFVSPLSQISDATTVGRYNIWMLDALEGGAGDANAMMWGVSKRHVGQGLAALFIFGAFVVSFCKWRSRPMGICVATSCLMLALVNLLTGMHGRYLVLAVPFVICITIQFRGILWAVIPFLICGGLEISRDFWRDAPSFEAFAMAQREQGDTTPLSNLTDADVQQRFEAAVEAHRPLTYHREWYLAATLTLTSFVLFFAPLVEKEHRRVSLADPPSKVIKSPTSHRSPSWRDLATMGLALLAIKTLVIAWGTHHARTVPMDRGGYENNYHHHHLQARYLDEGQFDAREIWSTSDAQWYSAIAEDGYPSLPLPQYRHEGGPKRIDHVDTHLKYVFFPLWPLTMRTAWLFVGNLYVAGLLASNLASLSAMLLLFWYLAPRFSSITAFWTILLLAASPFSVFYQAPFTESLFLLWVVIVFVTADRHQWLACGIAIGLASITRPNGVFLSIIPLTCFLTNAVRRRSIKWHDVTAFMQLAVAGVPVYFWLLLNKARTGNPFFFRSAIGWWGYEGRLSFANLWNTMSGKFEHFSSMSWHSFHDSQLDFIVFLLAIVLLVIAFRTLPLHYSLFAVTVIAVPLLSKDLMSFSRYVVVAWPLWLAFVGVVRPRYRHFVCGILLLLVLAGQLINAEHFVNWQWVG